MIDREIIQKIDIREVEEGTLIKNMMSIMRREENKEELVRRRTMVPQTREKTRGEGIEKDPEIDTQMEDRGRDP